MMSSFPSNHEMHSPPVKNTVKLQHPVPRHNLALAYLYHLITGVLHLTPALTVLVFLFSFLKSFAGDLPSSASAESVHLRGAFFNFPNYSSSYSPTFVPYHVILFPYSNFHYQNYLAYVLICSLSWSPKEQELFLSCSLLHP